MNSTLIMLDAHFPTKKSLFFFVPGVASDQPNESEIALGLSEDMLMDCGTPEPLAAPTDDQSRATKQEQANLCAVTVLCVST